MQNIDTIVVDLHVVADGVRLAGVCMLVACCRPSNSIILAAMKNMCVYEEYEQENKFTICVISKNSAGNNVDDNVKRMEQGKEGKAKKKKRKREIIREELKEVIRKHDQKKEKEETISKKQEHLL